MNAKDIVVLLKHHSKKDAGTMLGSSNIKIHIPSLFKFWIKNPENSLASVHSTPKQCVSYRYCQFRH